MVAPWPVFEPGGVAKVIASLGAALERAGQWHVSYLEIAAHDGDPAGATGPKVYRRRIRPFPPPRSRVRTWLVFAVTLIPALLRMHALLRRERIAVVNVHYPTPEAWLFAALRRTRLYRGRLVLSVHGLDIRETLRHPQRTRAMRVIYSAADLVVACSNSLARDVPNLSPALASRTRAVHNGLDADFAVAGEPRSVLAGALPAEYPTVLSVATFEPKKGLDVLVKAFATCLQSHPALRLRMIGQRRPNGCTFDEVMAQVATLGLTNRVTTATDVPNEQVLAAMASADVLVLPSRQEPFGLVLLEAGILGTPIVATDVDGIPEVVPSDDYGLLVRADDPDAISKAILSILRDPAEARRRAANMQRRVRNEFTWDAAASKYTALIAELHGEGRNSRVRPVRR